MRKQEELKQQYADQIESEMNVDMTTGTYEQYAGDPAYDSIMKAFNSARGQWAKNPSRRYGDLAWFRSQMQELSKRNQYRELTGDAFASAKILGMHSVRKERGYDAEGKVAIQYKDAKGNMRTFWYEPYFETGDASGTNLQKMEDFLDATGIHIEKEYYKSATYETTSYSRPRVKGLRFSFTKPGRYVIDGQPIKVYKTQDKQGNVRGIVDEEQAPDVSGMKGVPLDLRGTGTWTPTRPGSLRVYRDGNAKAYESDLISLLDLTTDGATKQSMSGIVVERVANGVFNLYFTQPGNFRIKHRHDRGGQERDVLSIQAKGQERPKQAVAPETSVASIPETPLSPAEEPVAAPQAPPPAPAVPTKEFGGKGMMGAIADIMQPEMDVANERAMGEAIDQIMKPELDAATEATPPVEQPEEKRNKAQLFEQAVVENMSLEEVAKRARTLNGAALAYVRAQKGKPVNGSIDARELMNANMRNLFYAKIATALPDKPYTVTEDLDPETQVVVLKVEEKAKESATRGVASEDVRPKPTISQSDPSLALQGEKMREAVETENAVVVPQKVIPEKAPSTVSEATNADVQAPAPAAQGPEMLPHSKKVVSEIVPPAPPPSHLTLPRRPSGVAPDVGKIASPPTPNAPQEAPRKSFGEALQTFLKFVGEGLSGLTGWLRKRNLLGTSVAPGTKDSPFMVEAKRETSVVYQQELQEIHVALQNKGIALSLPEVKKLQGNLTKTREKESILKNWMNETGISPETKKLIQSSLQEARQLEEDLAAKERLLKGVA